MFYFKGTRKPDYTKTQKIDYDRFWAERGFEMRSKLLEREQIFFDWISEESKVLELGCGNSRLLWELKNKKRCQVLAMDISALAIQGLLKEGINAKVANIEDPNFSIEGDFDYIIMSEVLEHLRFPEDMIKKLSAHTNFFVLSVPNSAFYRYRLGLLVRGRFFTQWAMHPSEHLRYWSHKDFLDWLRAMNLEVVRSRASNGFWFKNFWSNMLGHQICYLAKTRDVGN